MNFKKLLGSKTFWTGLGTVGYGVYLIASGNVETGAPTIAAGLGMIFIRDSISKVENEKNKHNRFN